MTSSKNDSLNWNLDYSDISDIFKNNLKIENTLKSIQSIFLNERFSKKINYKPYFQRNYVWDTEKASYFIESVLLGTEIPPLVFFKGGQFNEVIDGRQRFETLKKFIGNDIELNEKGLRSLNTFSNMKYVGFDTDTQDLFNNTKLRILQCSVSNEPSLTPEKEDKIKKEIFKRYNSGITPLKREENARAEFINDKITLCVKTHLEENKKILTIVEELFLPKSKQKANDRDKINILLDRIRTLLTLTEVPISDYARSSHRADVIRKYYHSKTSKRDASEVINKLTIIIDLLDELKKEIGNYATYNNALFYESLFWAISILLDEGLNLTIDNVLKIANDLKNISETSDCWDEINNSILSLDSIFELTGSHYRNATIDRYRFWSNYFKNNFGIDYASHMKDTMKHSAIMENNIARDQLKTLKLIKPDPVSVTIDDIISDMKNQKFLVRPEYQRSEVKNIQKSSYLLESIMLGIKIPPIYIYRREDRVKEVIDGQQRLLTLLGFLGETYIDELGKEQVSDKHKFKLSGLKILKELNGMNVDKVKEEYEHYIDNILDFSIDVVEIDQSQNPDFNSIDLFLRLNTKPFPIKANTFEMWNAYVDKELTQMIKDIAVQYETKVFRAKDTRMSNEELITALAYLDFQIKHNNLQYTDLLTVYIRDTTICSRISSKDRITKMLENLTSADIIKFHSSIQSVMYFVSKIQKIIDMNSSAMFDILGTRRKTDQNFYFLWIALEELTEEMIEERYEEVLIMLTEKFRIIQNAPEMTDISNFIQSLKNMWSPMYNER